MALRLWTFITLVLWMCSACNFNRDFNGSFEEARGSGRLFWGAVEDPGLDSYRFFRLHLRQFDNEIGGVFETFDMSSIDAFEQVPTFMEYAVKNYYCARIELGYVRDHTAHVIFKDREQRRWVISLELGEKTLYGSLSRMKMDSTDLATPKTDYLLPQDVAYFATPWGYSQMIFDVMPESSQRSLECIYYYKNTDIDFTIDERLLETKCSAPRTCPNLRLGIVGSPPIAKQSLSSLPELSEIVSATLQDCDFKGQIRTISLRDNPNTSNQWRNSLFLATAIVYDDVDLNGSWDHSTDPIYAMIDNGALLFRHEQTQPVFYGSLPEDISPDTRFDDPVISESDFGPLNGWTACSESDYPTSQDSVWRIPTKLQPSSSAFTLRTIEGGCLFEKRDDDTRSLPLCTGLLPVLLY